MKRQEKVQVLALSLYGKDIAYLAGFNDGKNIVSFTPEYILKQARPTLSLAQLHCPELLVKPWITQQRLHPILSNLLPEGALRTWIAQSLKVHEEQEFPLFAWLGQDLPGALIATPLMPEQVPEWALTSRDLIEPIILPASKQGQRFSLAGVQIKFSSILRDGRYQVSSQGELGNWIIKTPSTLHPGVPLNEYSMMKLASLAGVEIPDIELLPLKNLRGLPNIQLPTETYAYAIKRFDRIDDGGRVHSEDFAQITLEYAHEKYQKGNYETIGRILYHYSEDGLAAVQQFARRLLVNILLANGDAHLKNWSVIYPGQIKPVLSPAYDIVYTQAYIPGETSLALNLAGEKNWYKINVEHFKRWAEKIGVNWASIEVHLHDTLERARILWPAELENLPMLDHHKAGLKQHWSRLSQDWQI
ncbi:MAG: type II toxin-antitoxin system HipA family toxin [Gammaproteobacteria bacterium]|nr:type II toxin-antitoxin system HipA family toxin [Gammaproteobacteria bacterium]